MTAPSPAPWAPRWMTFLRAINDNGASAMAALVNGRLVELGEPMLTTPT